MKNLVLMGDPYGPPTILLGSSSDVQSYGLSPLSSPNSASPRTDGTTSRGPSLVRDSHAVVHQRYHSIGNGELSKATRAAESPVESPHPIPPLESETAGAETTCASDRSQSQSGSREHAAHAAHDDDRNLTVSVAPKFGLSNCEVQHPYTAPQNPHVANPVRPARSQSANVEEVWKSMHRTSHIFTRNYATLEVKYVLKERLGDGAMGVVRRCVEMSTGQEWACKSIDKSLLRCQEDVEGLCFEVAAMRSLMSHPYIVGLYDLMEDETMVHLVMEYCKGGELFDAIIRQKRYPEAHAARVIRAVISAVHFMHSKGIVHLDLKPENVVLTRPDSFTSVRVVDFGQAARCQPDDKLTTLVGSAYYVSPEVIRRSYGPQTDIWSTGVMLYALLCGSPPFYAKEKADIFEKITQGVLKMDWGPWKRISEGAKDLVRRMLTVDPDQRITSAQIKDHPWILKYCQPKPRSATSSPRFLEMSPLHSPHLVLDFSEGHMAHPPTSPTSPSHHKPPLPTSPRTARGAVHTDNSSPRRGAKEEATAKEFEFLDCFNPHDNAQHGLVM